MKTYRFSWTEIDNALAAIGGLDGLPLLLRSVGGMLPGAGMPDAVVTALSDAVAARHPFVVTLEAGQLGAWRVEVTS